jgi:glycosyltransferase involved in cell wall biosynthesis
MKLAVFPSDDLEEYIKKGEIRKNYFNPNNLFSKIYIINMSAKKSIDKKNIQYMCGSAEFEIIFIGEQKPIEFILDTLQKNQISEKVYQILERKGLKEIDIIRSYGMIFNSYIASYCAKKLRVPFVLSLHDNYNDVRYIARKSGQYKNWMFYLYWKHIERKILNDASEIIAVYGYAKKYALEMGIPSEKISIIYNRINPELKPVKIPSGKTLSEKNKKFQKFKAFTVINVMRQNWMKNQRVLIEAVAGIPDVNLLLIGNGSEHKNLVKLANDLKCSDRVIFVTSVMNKDLPSYFQRSHVFASSIKQGGVGIPDLEAFATGLPVIHAKYWNEKNPDILSEYALRVENNSTEFKKAIITLKNDAKAYRMYALKGPQLTKKINYVSESRKEERLYNTILHKHKV